MKRIQLKVIITALVFFIFIGNMNACQCDSLGTDKVLKRIARKEYKMKVRKTRVVNDSTIQFSDSLYQVSALNPLGKTNKLYYNGRRITSIHYLNYSNDCVIVMICRYNLNGKLIGISHSTP